MERIERIAIRETRWQRQAHAASILSALVTAGSMLFGVWTYRHGAADQRRTAAIGLLQEHLKLAVEHPDLAHRVPDQPVDPSYDAYATHALFTAETLWSLVGDDTDWNATIGGMLRQHRGYLTQGALPCSQFQPEFVTYMRQHSPGLRCAPVATPASE